MDEMLHHSKAVARGSDNCFKVGDLPFGAYVSLGNELFLVGNSSSDYQLGFGDPKCLWSLAR